MVFPKDQFYDRSDLVDIPLTDDLDRPRHCDSSGESCYPGSSLDSCYNEVFNNWSSSGEISRAVEDKPSREVSFQDEYPPDTINSTDDFVPWNISPKPLYYIKPRNLSGRRASLDSLLHQIYRVTPKRRMSSIYETESSENSGVTDFLNETRDHRKTEQKEMRLKLISLKSKAELRLVKADLASLLTSLSSILLKELKKRDKLKALRHRSYDVITATLHAHSEKRSQDTRMKFSVEPFAGDSGFAQWHDAMKMCARLPGGIPQEFRRRMWLTLSEQHVRSRNIHWKEVERTCFNEWASPDDEGLGDQIVKDLHRTGCSLFCGEDADVNQALLKRVLLGFARWNKSVGYCQGFNMLAAIILKVMDRQESDALKVMIYLIEGVLPESYFANNLRGLSVDMAVFRELMRAHLPALSAHLESLQHDAADKSTGACYEPPLTNVFTMQWFLTLFSNCLPEDAVMRVWDLTFLQGNEVLLRTALAIWGRLSSRILDVPTADEFYTVMGNLTREMLAHGLMESNQLVQTIVGMAPFPFPGLASLRDKYTYNITPWTQSVSSVARKGLRIFYLEDDDVDEEKNEDHQKLAVAAAFGLAGLFKKSSDSRHHPVGHHAPTRQVPSPVEAIGSIRPNLDISSLKKQYDKLRERQRQAHIILTASHAGGPKESSRRPSVVPKGAPLAMKHLLRGKKALTSKTKKVVNEGMIPSFIPKRKVERKTSDSTGLKEKAIKHDSLRKCISSKCETVVPKTEPATNPSETLPSLPEPTVANETLLWKNEPRRSRRASLPYGVKLMHHSSSSSLPDIEDDDGTASSTSTELCDDDDMKNLSDDQSTEQEALRALSTSPRLENVPDKAFSQEADISLATFMQESKQTQLVLDHKIEAILSREVKPLEPSALETRKADLNLDNLVTDSQPGTKPSLSPRVNSSKRKMSSASLSSPTKWKWSFSEVDDPDLMNPVSPILKLHNFESEDVEHKPISSKTSDCPAITLNDDSPVPNLSFINYDKSNMFSYLFEITDITKLSNNNSEEPSPIEENKYFNTEQLELAIARSQRPTADQVSSSSPGSPIAKDCVPMFDQVTVTVTPSDDFSSQQESSELITRSLPTSETQENMISHKALSLIEKRDGESNVEEPAKYFVEANNLKNSGTVLSRMKSFELCSPTDIVGNKLDLRSSFDITERVLVSPQEVTVLSSDNPFYSPSSIPVNPFSILTSSPTEIDSCKTIACALSNSCQPSCDDNIPDISSRHTVNEHSIESHLHDLDVISPMHQEASSFDEPKEEDHTDLQSIHEDIPEEREDTLSNCNLLHESNSSETLHTMLSSNTFAPSFHTDDDAYSDDSLEDRLAELLTSESFGARLEEDDIKGSPKRSKYFSDILKSLSLETNYSEIGELWPEKDSCDCKDTEEVTSEVIRRRLWAGVKFLSLDTESLTSNRLVDKALESNFPSLPTLEESPVESYKPLPRNLDYHQKFPASPCSKTPKRRKSEAALQLMKENTKLIDRFLKRRASEKDDTLLVCGQETEHPKGPIKEESRIKEERLSASKSFTSLHSEEGTTHPSKMQHDSDIPLSPPNDKLAEAPKCPAQNRDSGSASDSDGSTNPPSSITVPFSLCGSLNSRHCARQKSLSLPHQSSDTVCTTGLRSPRRLSTNDQHNAKCSSAKVSFNPFPNRAMDRPPKDVAIKLGLYAAQPPNRPVSPS